MSVAYQGGEVRDDAVSGNCDGAHAAVCRIVACAERLARSAAHTCTHARPHPCALVEHLRRRGIGRRLVADWYGCPLARAPLSLALVCRRRAREPNRRAYLKGVHRRRAQRHLQPDLAVLYRALRGTSERARLSRAAGSHTCLRTACVRRAGLLLLRERTGRRRRSLLHRCGATRCVPQTTASM